MSETTKDAGDPDYGFAAVQWWQTLTGKHPTKNQSGKDRAARARLRRASPSDAICEEATLQLLRALKLSRSKLPRVAALACVLATVREDEGRPFGRAIGREKIDEEQSAKLSALRFKRLLEAETEEEITTSFRRAVGIAGFAANVRELAKLLLFWEHESTKPRLIFDYYGAADRAADTQLDERAA